MKLTQEQVGELADTNARTISAIENGQSNTRMNILYPLIRVLRIDPNEIFHSERYTSSSTKQVVNNSVTTIDIDTMLEKAKQHLALSDSHQYGLQDIYGILKEEIRTSVDINEMCYGLIREKVPNTDDSYYYLPGIILYGVVVSVGAESNQLYFQSEEPFPIIALNAVDGTVVAFTNE